MKPMAAGLSPAQLYGVARFLTGKSPMPRGPGPDPNLCATQKPLDLKAARVERLGSDLANSRYQPRPPASTAADIPRLKVKWAFSYPGTKNTQPLIFGDRVFVASMAGKVYSLDAKTGCVHWRYDSAGRRARLDDHRADGQAPPASTPSTWATTACSCAPSTPAPARSCGRPGSATTSRAASPARRRSTTACSTCRCRPPKRARAPALRVLHLHRHGGGGRRQDRQDPVEAGDPRRASRSRRARTRPASQMYGPAGGASGRRRPSTPSAASSTSPPATATPRSSTPRSDAVVAMDLKTGKIRWVNQVLAARQLHARAAINGPPCHARCRTTTSAPRQPGHRRRQGPGGHRQQVLDRLRHGPGHRQDRSGRRPSWASAARAGGVEWSARPPTARCSTRRWPTRRADGKPGLVALDAANGKVIWRVDGRAVADLQRALRPLLAGLFAGGHR